MKIFGRFLYALLAVGVFLLTFELSLNQMRKIYYEDVFGQSLVDEDSSLPEFYYFYASIPDFHKKDPIIEVDVQGYQIRGYEIARTEVSEDELQVEEKIFFIVYHEESQKLSDLEHIKISNGLTKDDIMISLLSYRELDILSSVNIETSSYLVEKDTFDFTKNYDQLSLINHSGDSVIESAFNLSESDFIIKDNLENFYQEYNELPTVETLHLLENSNIQLKENVITTNDYIVNNYLYIMGIYMGVFLLLLIFSTYFIFFRKKKKQPII